ncbi:CAMK family protein kinase [Histomonas meleagridis]|uniref:CAMK family protein kinase n=1 Tax=Histomonas meleagridis TaxID=135588 RepID=UPI003559F1C3|nr:CAMK family protein kinase [Histomonas meleagridis]KAH0800589.1 CAMK family protein kinase [Histomonas meleagridis]
MGRVHLATRIYDGLKCCMKSISKSYLEENQIVDYDVKLKGLLKMSHPNIVKYLDFFEDNENFYIFMEFCEGQDLLKLINTNHGIHEPDAKKIITQLANVLVYMNEHNITHRDIKPENIIVNSSYQVKLIDFGICSLNPIPLLTTYCGSIEYTAPETILHQPYVGSKADVWSCGVVLYAMLSGELPWNTHNIQIATQQIIAGRIQFPPTFPPLAANLVHLMLKVDPSKRISANQILTHIWLNTDTVHSCSQIYKNTSIGKYSSLVSRKRNLLTHGKITQNYSTGSGIKLNSAMNTFQQRQNNKNTLSANNFQWVSFRCRKRSLSSITSEEILPPLTRKSDNESILIE